MSQSPPPSGSTPPPPGSGDPWAAFGYLVAGIGFYGAIGWGLGVWLHARYLTAVGIVVGAALAITLVFITMARIPPTVPNAKHDSGRPGRDDEAPHDRGETE